MISFHDVIVSSCRRLRVDPYWVGGTVRDRLLGRDLHDWDLVCAQARRAASAVARRLSAKLIVLDEQHRIYRVILPNRTTLDFAELQGTTIQQDLSRRDFTLNAMALPLTPAGVKGLIDPFNGQKDLKNGILRALSRKVFVEDPLRLLRAYRMAAQFNLAIEPRTSRWIVAEQKRLNRAARERVREELLRLLSQTQSGDALAAMDKSGLLTTIFPELEAGRRVGVAYYGKGGVVKHHLQSVANVEWLLERLDAVAFIERTSVLGKVQNYVRQLVGGVPRAALLKLGALLHDIGKPATAEVIRGRLRFFGHEEVGAQIAHRTLGALRFSRQEGSLIRLWVRHHMRPGNLASAPRLTEKAMARFFRDLGEDGVGMLLLSLGDHYTYLARSQWGKAKDAVEKTAQRLLSAYYLKRERVLPPKIVDGHDLMKALHLKPGPVIGTLLEAVRDAQAGGKVKTRDEALAFARRVRKST
ncbi:MAG: hypothetical protein A2992_01415 [Elusimicrobia bacterium RIFCSPLOWO2_01_FULL_59_12]|nr:MAG: hypothetical protein A2992_01415 [Elusimicrobia bacterium RIFCSPLOWO2_01_FULL_59_12]